MKKLFGIFGEGLILIGLPTLKVIFYLLGFYGIFKLISGVWF